RPAGRLGRIMKQLHRGKASSSAGGKPTPPRRAQAAPGGAHASDDAAPGRYSNALTGVRILSGGRSVELSPEVASNAPPLRIGRQAPVALIPGSPKTRPPKPISRARRRTITSRLGGCPVFGALNNRASHFRGKH